MRKKILPRINSNKFAIPNLKEFNYDSDSENNNNNFIFTSSIFILNKNELNKDKKISNFQFLSDKNNKFIFDNYIQNQVTERKKNINKKIKLKSISTNFDLNNNNFNNNNNNEKFKNLEKNLSNNLITSNNFINITDNNNKNKIISRNNKFFKNKFKVIYTSKNNKIPTLMNNNKNNNNITKNSNKICNNLSLNKIIKKERVLNLKFSEKYGIKLYF